MRKCYIVINTYNSEAEPLAGKVQDFLKGKDVDVVLYRFFGTQTTSDDVNDISKNKMSSNFLIGASADKGDFVITLGGDGTVLFAARCCATYGISIFPINLGKFGFIAGISKDNWQFSLEKFLKDKLPIVSRSMVKTTVIRAAPNGVFSPVFAESALNEVTVSGNDSVRIISLQVDCKANKDDDTFSFGRFRSDGVIVATATGSTAYCAAAGGPIVDPALDVFVLNPICPFSLSNRPIVLPPEMVMSITVLPSRGAGVILSIDGQITFEVIEGDKIIVERSPSVALLAGCNSTGFYKALRSKLNWSGGAD